MYPSLFTNRKPFSTTAPGNDLYAAEKFDDYIGRVQNKGLCLPFVGETGSNGDARHDWAALFAYAIVLKEHQIGTVAWHPFDGDRFSLCEETTTKESCWATAINDLDNPTNLTDRNGLWHWKGTRENGYGALAQRGTSSGGGGDEEIVVRARGIDGSEQITLQLDGQDVKTWTLTTTLADYRYQGSVSGKQIRVAYTNDALDRDAFVDYVRVGSTTLQAEDQAVNTAAWEDGTCGGDYSEWMQCAGYIAFRSSTANAQDGSDSFRREVPSEALSAEMLIYPNPFSSGLLTISLPDEVEEASVVLSNMAGQEVLRKTLTSSSYTLPRHLFPSGSYILQIVSPKLTHTQKVIIR